MASLERCHLNKYQNKCVCGGGGEGHGSSGRGVKQCELVTAKC